MTEGERRQLRSSPQIDPSQYSATTSSSRLHSFGYALSGCAYMLFHQKNTRILLAATLAVLAVGLWLGIETDDWATLVLTIGIVWIAEFLNAAIEASVNLATPDIHPMAKVAKDVAAGAVLIAAFVALVVGLLVLGPPLAAKISAGAATG
ncbi:MAG: diacylglycerol kinase family protein [Chloroflexi bacterium]|nr:diacylglycerol kinase family protein [Chloroflexota bacterium]